MNTSFYGTANTSLPEFIQYNPSKAAKLPATKDSGTGQDNMKTPDVVDLLTEDEDSTIESVNGSSEHKHQENSNKPALENCSQGSTVVSYNSQHEPSIGGSHPRDDEKMTQTRKLSHPDEVDVVHPAKSSPTMDIQSLEGANGSIKMSTLQTTNATSSTSKRRRSPDESNNYIHYAGGKRRKANTRSLQRITVDTDCEYEVKSICAVRVTKDGRRQYRVEWSEDLRWYDEADLRNCPLKIREFYEKNPEADDRE